MDRTIDPTTKGPTPAASNRATPLTPDGRPRPAAPDSLAGAAARGAALRPAAPRQVDARHVDARLFVALSGRLKDAFGRLGGIHLSAQQRDRWRNRLIAITDAAHDDLVAAARQLDDYEADFDREAVG